MKSWLVMLLSLACSTTLAGTPRPPAQPLISSDGQGNVRLFWGAPPKAASLRLETDDGQVLIERITPLPGVTDQGERALAILHALSDWERAKALGLAAELHGLPPRKTVFVLRRLDTGKAVRSDPIDLAQASPAPAAAEALRAVADAGTGAVQLYWRTPTSSPPVLAWRVERDDGQGRVVLGGIPHVTGGRWPADKPVLTDRPERSEVELVYEVRGIDPLGRESHTASVRVFFPDFTALAPPQGLRAESTRVPVTLRWQANASRNTRGYLVERAFQTAGPWEVLTPQGVRGDTTYTDRDARPGSTLFYRLRAIGPRGDIGQPGLPLPVNVRGEPPTAPSGLAAETGYTRVRLTWQPVAGAAGYHVERRAGATAAWSRLTSAPTPESRYDDLYGGSPGGRFAYRVRAIGPDQQEGPPGEVLQVELPDTMPPPPPHVVAASGDGGRVRLQFRAVAPENDTARVLALRSTSAEAPGLVIGDPIAAETGEFIDTWVEPGQSYVYRLVAVDAAGNRSDPGTPVRVRVGPPPLVAPDRPTLRYAASPFPHVRLAFSKPAAGLRVLVEARGEGEAGWRTAAGPVLEGEALDLSPRHGETRYRIRYQSADGTTGPASQETAVVVP